MRKIIGILIFLIICACSFVLLPYFIEMPSGRPGSADAIVVLGGGGEERLSTAFDLYKIGCANKFILPGVKHIEDEKTKNLDTRLVWLIDKGVPRKDIFVVDKSPSSWLEAKRTLEVMKQHGWKKVLVVSDPPHMLRLSYSWGKIFFGESQEYTLFPTKPAWWTPWRWWQSEASSAFIYNEVLKLAYYIVMH